MRGNLLAFSLTCLLFLRCSKKEASPPADILVRIDDKIITAGEFMRRAEYTPRPVYCRGEDYIQRKITLNSLIAEKLLALEAGENNELTRNQDFQLYLQGRKEQAMRQWQYYQEAYHKVRLDTLEIHQQYNLAGRKYQVAFYSISDSATARRAHRELGQNAGTFAHFYQDTGALGEIPQREVAWEAEEDEAIHEALFAHELRKNAIVGPLPTPDNHFVVMKVLGWTDRVAISDAQIKQRWQQVSESLTQKQAAALYEQYVAQVMRGKTIEFSSPIFKKLVAFVAPYYLRTRDQKESALSQRLWGKTSADSAWQKLGAQPENFLEEPLFRVDGQIWTVREAEQETRLHPLLFRKQNLTTANFAEQFKLALVDMVRDRFLTQEAYHQGFDQAEEVRQTTGMWKDNLLCLYQQQQYLKSLHKQEDFNKDYLKIINSDLNPYLERLQAKYSSRIEINTEAFEKIKLTGVDMFVVRRGDPFPIVVPNFPLLTTDSQLNYGRKLR